MQTTLSTAEPLTIPLAVFQLVFSAVVSVTLWRLTAWQRRYEGLETRLQEATSRLVDERFRAVSVEVDVHVRGMLRALEELNQRLAVNDRRFAEMADRDQRIELAVATKLDLLKDYLRDFAAGRVDLDRHEAAVERRLAGIERRLTSREDEGA
jgi:hypothetical protein